MSGVSLIVLSEDKHSQKSNSQQECLEQARSLASHTIMLLCAVFLHKHMIITQ